MKEPHVGGLSTHRKQETGDRNPAGSGCSGSGACGTGSCGTHTHAKGKKISRTSDNLLLLPYWPGSPVKHRYIHTSQQPLSTLTADSRSQCHFCLHPLNPHMSSPFLCSYSRCTYLHKKVIWPNSATITANSATNAVQLQ